MSEATFQALLECHPSPHPDSEISPIDKEVSTIMTVSEEEVSHGISLFRKGSAGGPDGLRPQHLNDMVLVASSSQVLLPACPHCICPTQAILHIINLQPK